MQVARAEQRVAEVELVGQLTLEKLRPLLDGVVPPSGATEKLVLLVDCSRMDGYDAAAREYFVTWNSGMKPLIRKLAVVTPKPLWHMVFGTVIPGCRTPGCLGVGLSMGVLPVPRALLVDVSLGG